MVVNVNSIWCLRLPHLKVWHCSALTRGLTVRRPGSDEKCNEKWREEGKEAWWWGWVWVWLCSWRGKDMLVGWIFFRHIIYQINRRVRQDPTTIMSSQPISVFVASLYIIHNTRSPHYAPMNFPTIVPPALLLLQHISFHSSSFASFVLHHYNHSTAAGCSKIRENYSVQWMLSCFWISSLATLVSGFMKRLPDRPVNVNKDINQTIFTNLFNFTINFPQNL